MTTSRALPLSGVGEHDPAPKERLPAFVCVGAAHWDVIGRTRRGFAAGSDFPGTVIRRPGGVALNVAAGLAATCQRATLVAAIGADAEGDELVSRLKAANVDCGGVLRPSGRTDAYVALELPGGGLHAAVADCGLLEANGEALVGRMIGMLKAINEAGVWPLVFLDGNLPGACIAEAIDILPASARIAFAAASPAKAERALCLRGDERAVVYLNRAEAEAICRRALADSTVAAQALLQAGFAEVIVTNGPDAASHARADLAVSMRPGPIDVAGVTGAGDMLVASHLAARAEGADASAALKAALAAAARHVSGAPR